jgi:hypothetical protein
MSETDIKLRETEPKKKLLLLYSKKYLISVSFIHSFNERSILPFSWTPKRINSERRMKEEPVSRT